MGKGIPGSSRRRNVSVRAPNFQAPPLGSVPPAAWRFDAEVRARRLRSGIW
jgi:hypothetical protein